METKEELEKEKLRYDIKNLKYGWVQRFTAITGIGIVLTTTIATNINEYLKIKRLENKEKQVATQVQTEEKLLQREIDSLKKFDLSPLNKEIRLSEDYNTDRASNKEQPAAYYRNELDSLTGLILKTKSIKETLLNIANKPKADTSKNNKTVN